MTTTKRPATTKSRNVPAAAYDRGFELMRLAADRHDLDQKITEAVRAVLDAGGTWTTVAVALGVTKQSAQGKYGPLLSDRQDEPSEG